MKILLVGENKEKGGVLARLHERLPNYQVVEILESESSVECMRDIVETRDIIVNISAIWDSARVFASMLEPKSYLLLKVADDTESGKDVDSLFRQNAIGERWVDASTDLASLALERYEYLVDTIHTLASCPEVREVVLYGSIARREWLTNGDGDIMVTCDMSKQEIQDMLESVPGVTFCDILPDKVTVYFGDFLIEVAVVSSVEENKLYYVNSYIQDTRYSIIKGDGETLDRLVAMQKSFVVDGDKLIAETVSRLVYFVLSMDGIARSGNEYKFFFHSNIITHEMIRLSKLLQGEYKYEYLPKDSDKIYKAMQAQYLVYTYSMDKQKYLSQVRGAAKQLINKVNNIDKKYINIL